MKETGQKGREESDVMQGVVGDALKKMISERNSEERVCGWWWVAGEGKSGRNRRPAAIEMGSPWVVFSLKFPVELNASGRIHRRPT